MKTPSKGSHAEVIVQGTAMVPPPRSGHAPLLIIDLTITCDVCDQRAVRFCGLHIKPIIRALQDLVTEFPELCDEGEIESETRNSGAIHPERN